MTLPYRNVGLGPFDHELPDSTIQIQSHPFVARHGDLEGTLCCYVTLEGRRQLMAVESIRHGIRRSHAMDSAQSLVASRPPEIPELQAQYTALWRAMEETWELFEAVYGDGDPEMEKRRRQAFARDFGGF